MGIVYLLIGVVVGVLLGVLFMRTKSSSTAVECQNKLNALETERLLALEKQQSAFAEMERAKVDYTLRITKLEEELKSLRTENLEMSNRLTSSREHFKAQEQRLNEQKTTLDEVYKKMASEFENTSNRLLEAKSQKFTDQNRTQLDIILNPLKDKLKDFEDKVDKTYKAESEERIGLKAEVKQLMELNKQLSEDSKNLTSALKGDNKQQGNWGELILEKVLERSGLEKDREYKTQYNTVNDDDQRIKPDVIVFLPDEKHIIIDAKVSLDAYNMYNAVNTDEERDRYAKLHIESVRSHVKQLSDKKYQTSEGLHTPDFVMLFLPIESSFSLAVKIDEQLFSYAWDRKIVIVSPTTLLATLKTVSSIWRQERQTRNVLEIAKEGGALYDKFVGFLEDMDKINKALGASQTAYNEAMKKLSEGRANVIVQTEKLKKLGAKAEKSIPSKFLDNTLLEEQNTIEPSMHESTRDE